MVDKVIDKTCELWGITREDLMSGNRKRVFVLARSMVTWYFKTYSDMSNAEIARIWPINRTSLYNHINIYDYSMKYDKKYKLNAKLLYRYMKRDVLKDTIINAINEIMYGTKNF